MQITKTGTALTSANSGRLSHLSRGLKNTMNSFIGNPKNSPLTIQTLEEVKGRFFPSDPEIRRELIRSIWDFCKDRVYSELQNQDKSKSKRSNGNSPRKKPVLFSTAEGLDVVLGLKTNNGELKVKGINVNAGGCSVNIARALSNFGTDFELIGKYGSGEIGDTFSKALEIEGIDPANFITVKADTRLHFSTAINGNEYWLFAVSENLAFDEIGELTSRLLDTCKKQQKEVLALAVSEPPGASSEYLPEIIKETQDKFGMFVIYDPKFPERRGEYFRRVISQSPQMIKPNLTELSQILGVDEESLMQDQNHMIHLVQELIHKHDMKMVLVSLGKDGGMLISKKRVVVANAPKIKVASPGCAGDTGVAAMLDRIKKEKYSLGKLNDPQFKNILTAFIAGGVATAMHPGSELGTLEEAIDLEKQIEAKFVR